MANFFLDNKDLKYHLSHPLMRKIVELKERNFTEKDLYDYAPQNFEDAMDSYMRVMEIIGGVCADVIAPNAEGVDKEGPRVINDRVEYASGTVENMKAVNAAGLSGLTLPRRFKGLNFPLLCFVMANEMVARADASFENIWGLQDCAETLNEFASEEQKMKYLTWVSEGATCAMDLTEPDAGSDLGAVMLKATWSEERQTWFLNGVERFITNGDGDISLVLARTEEGTKDARGLSMLVHDRRNGGMKVRRIENKLGIKGSPTCEVVFTDAPAELAGYAVVKDIAELGKVDVAILATPTRSVEEYALKCLALGINTVDSYDIHSSILDLRRSLSAAAKQYGAVSIVSAGWDPGSDSIVRTLMESLAPKGLTYTNFGPGRSMGHSVCVRSKAGVKDALSMTIPVGEGIHRRMVYVELEEGASLEDETHVFQVESVDALNDVGHGVNLVRKGVSGQTHNQLFEFNMKINNPALTAQVLVNAARATMRQQPGAYTMIEIPVIDYLPGDREQIIAHLV